MAPWPKTGRCAIGATATGRYCGAPMLLHLDTDFAGDTDDACALAMVLGWPDTELVGITTTADPGGLRAGYLAYFLGLAGSRISLLQPALRSL